MALTDARLLQTQTWFQLHYFTKHFSVKHGEQPVAQRQEDKGASGRLQTAATGTHSGGEGLQLQISGRQHQRGP